MTEIIYYCPNCGSNRVKINLDDQIYTCPNCLDDWPLKDSQSNMVQARIAAALERIAAALEGDRAEVSGRPDFWITEGPPDIRPLPTDELDPEYEYTGEEPDIDFVGSWNTGYEGGWEPVPGKRHLWRRRKEARP